MANHSAHEAPTILTIPQPAARRVIAISFIAVFLALFTTLPSKLGFGGFFKSLFHFSATWLVMSMFAAPIAFFARLAFPPRKSLPRLEVSRSYIRVVPGRIARLFAETAVEIALAPQAKEILLCRVIGDGLRLIVRDADGAERQIRATSMDYLSARDAQVLAEGISGAIGLPVLLLARGRRADGAIRETSWIQPSGGAGAAIGAAVATVAIPFVGGAVVGILWPSPAVMLAVGLGLWLCQMGTLIVIGRLVQPRAKFPTLYSLKTVFSFAAAYGLALVAVRLFLRSP
jgi:hypothetical protein